MFGLGGGSSHYDNPADSAMPFLRQIPDTVSPYFNRYINLGNGAARVTTPIYYQRAKNPAGAYNDIMGGYEESPAYKYNYDQAMKEEQGAAARAGYTGTPYDQTRQAQTAQGLLAQDEERYYRDVLGLQNSGLEEGNNLFNTGYGASTSLADILGQNLAAQAGLAYQGTAFEDQLKAQQRANRNALLGTLGGGAFGYASSFNQPRYY